MQSLNFKLTNNDVFQDNPEFAAIPEFNRLTPRQMRYVMLVDWYGSPLRLMKLEARKLRAAITSEYKMEKDGKRPDTNTRNLIGGLVGNVEAARKVMADIQHSIEMDIKEALDTQIEEIIMFFKKPDKSPTELEKATKLMTQLPTLLETKRKILELLNFTEPSFVVEDIKEDSESSFLDEYNETN